MASITLTSVSLDQIPIANQSVNIKYRLTSDPDVGGSYTNAGNFDVDPSGTFLSPVVIGGLPDSTQYTVWATILCSNSQFLKDFTTTGTPSVPCGTASSYSGGESFPTEQIVTLGSDMGTVTLTYDAFTIPDKFIVIFDGVEVINTGYRGDSSEQSALDAALAARSLPPETIAGTGAGTDTFTKSTATTTAIVRVYAPLSGTSWNYTLSCPVPIIHV